MLLGWLLEELREKRRMMEGISPVGREERKRERERVGEKRGKGPERGAWIYLPKYLAGQVSVGG